MTETSAKAHWVRSSHGVIAGVCQGLGEHLGIEPWILRVVWVLSLLLFGAGLWLYLIFTLCLPRDDRWEAAQGKMIMGVCSRIAKRGDVEVGIARLGAVILLLFSGGTAIVGYLVLYFLLPDPDRANNPNQPTSIL